MHRDLLAANDVLAGKNREIIEGMGAIALNLISAPGSGKTTLLEKTIECLADRVHIGVIEGDIETARDAERIRAKGVPAVQLTTGGACHLDASLVNKGLHALADKLNGGDLDLIFIENVGNLVCPATFYLGEHKRAVLVSVPEGPDKPAKYPRAFMGADLFLITKTDLLPYFDFLVDEARSEALKLNPELEIISLSSVNNDGFDQWITFLEGLLNLTPLAQTP